MTDFRGVRKGDELWMVNGRQTSAFEANVVDVTINTIIVAIPDKGDALFEFRRIDGTAATDPYVSESFLVQDDDWRVQVILDRKEHAAYHTEVLVALNFFRHDPSQKNAEDLTKMIEKWQEFVRNADSIALATENMRDYQKEWQNIHGDVRRV